MHFSIRFLSSQTVSIILTVLITFSALPSHAQDPDPFSYASRLQPSAEAWQMARHGEISPDLFTGAMAWSLPLYTYKDEDFTIPVSLNYRFDGCRPAQPSGTVGYGWSLNCGGVITRQVVGLPDDYVRQVVYVDTDGEQHESWEVGFYYAAIDHGFIPATSLGSTRTIVEGDDYTEVEQNDYYPFGKRIADNTLPTTATNRWRFSGKEIQTLGGIGLVDFGARLYDDFSGRWKTQDALSESYLGLSPYSYCSGDPIIYTDEEGYWIANVISAAVEYGFQVYNNYQKGLSGLDALINNIDFADVVIAAINPVGKFAAVKSLVTNMAKEAIDFTLSGDFSINADAETLENAAVNTLIDMGVGKVSNAGKTISETAKKEVKKASSNAIRKSNISKYRPRSTKRAKAAEDAQSALQAAREKEVAGEIITKTAPVADPLTKKTIENERDKKKHSKEK